MHHMSKVAHRENCQGIQSYASWDKTCDINHRAIAEYSWNFEASEIFTELRKDPSGDTELARRYAAELRNYRDMVDDYLALYKIHDLVTANESGAQAKVTEIAKERKLERYSLMAEMEDFKEEYLHASHLRNQSIFMQFFADLESYAESTPAEKFSINVEDMRKFASKAFMNLR